MYFGTRGRFIRVTDEGPVPKIPQYGTYYIPLKVFTASKASNFYIVLIYEQKSAFSLCFTDCYGRVVYVIMQSFCSLFIVSYYSTKHSLAYWNKYMHLTNAISNGIYDYFFCKFYLPNHITVFKPEDSWSCKRSPET